MRRKKDVVTTPPDDPKITIRPQIRQMAPMTVDELENAPTNTDEAAPQLGPNGRRLNKDGSERAPRGSRKLGQATQSNPLMDDPRYREAVADMNFFGAPRVIKRGFAGASKLMKDEEIKLNEEEERHIDNYFYALSKHMTFDPMAHLIGRVILFILLIGELVAWRWLKYSPYGEAIKKLLKPSDEKSEPEIVQ